MNTIDTIMTCISSKNAHMISPALMHRLMARICLLTPNTTHPCPSQTLAQQDARRDARECLLLGGDFSWFSEYAEQYGLYSADVWDTAWDSMTEKEPSAGEISARCARYVRSDFDAQSDEPWAGTVTGVPF